MEKVQKIVETNPEISFKNGILLIKDTALDVYREDDVRYHEELQKNWY